MVKKRFYFSWEEREKLKEAVLNAGGRILENPRGVNLFYLESNELYFGHDRRDIVTIEVNEIFAEEIISDLESKLGLKLGSLN
ncbi:hypothetical protein J4422_02985 [Candidatus Pacearchaeota archaeon]|nr:hypothetical protein [Candidatus Pacearchaeota archaeon]